MKPFFAITAGGLSAVRRSGGRLAVPPQAVMDSTFDKPSTAELLHDLLATDQEIADVLNEVAYVAASEVKTTLPVLCGITLERDKRITIVGSSDDEARRMDEVQAGFKEGPCLEAQATGTLISVHDVQDESRWPDYMAAVRDHGLRSVLAVPLDLGASAKAAINFYTSVPGAFGQSETATAKRFAALASRALRVAVLIARHAEEAEDRRRAMESRTVIDLAVGSIMAQNRCSQDEAFDILKTASSYRNIKLQQLAQDLIASLGQPAATTAFDQ